MSHPPVTPPVPPMLARLQAEIPRGEGWRYEPKWDGFRALVFRHGEDLRVLSRGDRPLGRYFPELAELLRTGSERSYVVDGEIVVVRPGRLGFDELLQRIHPAESRIRRLAGEWPATLILFDVLAWGKRDLRAEPTDARRRELERLIVGMGGRAAPLELAAMGPGPEILLTPRTSDPELASAWFSDEEGMGQDGIVARRAELPYQPGQRVMVKVKHRRTADCAVGGYRRERNGPGVASLLLGLYDREGVLQYVGHTSSFRARERVALLQKLAPLEGGESFGDGRAPGGPSRWSAGREAAWVPVAPELVCEVSFDRMQGSRFRHATTFRRWRPDRDPGTCTFDQLPAPG